MLYEVITRVVLRLLDKNNVRLELKQLGMTARNRELLAQLIRKPHGILLVTGPTGSPARTRPRRHFCTDGHRAAHGWREHVITSYSIHYTKLYEMCDHLGARARLRRALSARGARTDAAARHRPRLDIVCVSI